MSDIEYMEVAIDIAKRGLGHVNPNPLVGAVIVKNNKIIGKGWHEKYGGLHAEINALNNCQESTEGAIMYVTLEPCCHYGKTPPCTDAIIKSGINKVFIGSLDPNPLVSGKGASILRNAGIEVIPNLLNEKCILLNEVFFHYIKTKKPYIVMKYAMTMDGKIATSKGKSKWITGEKARGNVHKSRNQYSSIMVGVGTVIADNPLLSCRIEDGRNPIRIICDTNLITPFDSNIVKTAKEIKTIIATASSDKEKHEIYSSYGCQIIEVKLKNNHIDLNDLIEKLGEANIDSIFIEGGSTLNFSALQSGIVNKLQVYIAPKIFGGENAKTPVGGIGITNVDNCFSIINKSITYFDDDILVEGDVEYRCLQE